MTKCDECANFKPKEVPLPTVVRNRDGGWSIYDPEENLYLANRTPDGGLRRWDQKLMMFVPWEGMK